MPAVETSGGLFLSISSSAKTVSNPRRSLRPRSRTSASPAGIHSDAVIPRVPRHVIDAPARRDVAFDGAAFGGVGAGLGDLPLVVPKVPCRHGRSLPDA